MPEILKMPDVERMKWIRAEPTIFLDNQAQSQSGEYSSTNETNRKCRFKTLAPYNGMRTDTAFVEWMLSHFREGLINGERLDCSLCAAIRAIGGAWSAPLRLPQPLLRTQTRQESRTYCAQLLSKNPSESMVDKTNHLRDSLKYITGTIQSGAEILFNVEIVKQLVGLHPTTAAIRAQILIQQPKSAVTFSIGQTGQVIEQLKPPRIDFRRRRR